MKMRLLKQTGEKEGPTAADLVVAEDIAAIQVIDSVETIAAVEESDSGDGVAAVEGSATADVGRVVEDVYGYLL
jgi:hypothetical protein